MRSTEGGWVVAVRIVRAQPIRVCVSAEQRCSLDPSYHPEALERIKQHLRRAIARSGDAFYALAGFPFVVEVDMRRPSRDPGQVGMAFRFDVPAEGGDTASLVGDRVARALDSAWRQLP